MKRCMSKVVLVVVMLVVVFAGQIYAEDTYKAPSITYSYSNGVFGIMVLGVNYGAVSDFLLDDSSIGETLKEMATQGQLVVYQYTDWFYIGIYVTEEALAEFAGNNFQIALSEGTVLSKPLPEVSNLLPASEEPSAKVETKAFYPISSSEYSTLRKWVLGASGKPSGEWGQKHNDWCSIYPNCQHPGVDYSTGGKSIKASAVCDGKVTTVGGKYGTICIYNSKKNKTFCYLHMSSFNGLKVGDDIKKDKTIGMTGNKGTKSYHLHFEARNGKKTAAAPSYSESINPYDAAKSCR
ncbi:MAG: M23 family metallopeptidase [Nitrospirae bacterium]|uniref:M23 family metallopeptidase n=1 Tax=Candidatus Magnetobacterium casense TaxID=1455061 RepID=UPI00058AE0AF|nr:M23 family metallopeptidase [Candidatus Magnetobacterium casensis]MBF0337606.1 M23 family metallopeptidase [Nitrospirota bacterium]